MSGEVPAPAQVLKVPSLLHPQASHQRACGVAGSMATMMIAKYGKSGEAVDITRKRKITVGTRVSVLAGYVLFHLWTTTQALFCAFVF